MASSTSGWSGFVSTDPANNNAVWLNDAQGNRLCRLQISAYSSPTMVSVQFLDPVPAAVQNTPDSNWTYAKTNFSGLTQLVGATVAIQADGAVLPQQVVSGAGTLTLPNAGGVVHAGLPYVSQLQSLNFNIQGQPTIRNNNKTVSRVSVTIDNSAPFYVGPSFDNLVECPLREWKNFGQPTALHTGVVSIQVPSVPSDDLTTCVQMSDPAPLTVLGWIHDVDVGDKG